MMNEIQRQISEKEAELTAASAYLETSYANLQKLQRELPNEAARVQRLMTELAQLRTQLFVPQSTGTQPCWYDNAPHEGEMGDRRLKNN